MNTSKSPSERPGASFIRDIVEDIRQQSTILPISLNPDNLTLDELKAENERLREKIKVSCDLIFSDIFAKHFHSLE